MHDHPLNQEITTNLSTLTMHGLGGFSRVGSNEAAGSTPGGALPSIPLSVSHATMLSPEPQNFDFSEGAEGVMKQTTPQSLRRRGSVLARKHSHQLFWEGIGDVLKTLKHRRRLFLTLAMF